MWRLISSDSRPFTPSIYMHSSTIKSTLTINSPHRHHHHDESVLSNAFNEQLHVKEVMWLSYVLCTCGLLFGVSDTHTIATNIADCNSNVARENYRAPLFLFTCQEWVYNLEYATLTWNSNPYSTAFGGRVQILMAHYAIKKTPVLIYWCWLSRTANPMNIYTYAVIDYVHSYTRIVTLPNSRFLIRSPLCARLKRNTSLIMYTIPNELCTLDQTSPITVSKLNYFQSELNEHCSLKLADRQTDRRSYCAHIRISWPVIMAQ